MSDPSSPGAPDPDPGPSWSSPDNGGAGHQPSPGHEQPPGYQQPGYEQPPPYTQPGYQQPGYEQPGYHHPASGYPGHPHPGYAQPGHPGYQQAPPRRRTWMLVVGILLLVFACLGGLGQVANISAGRQYSPSSPAEAMGYLIGTIFCTLAPIVGGVVLIVLSRKR